VVKHLFPRGIAFISYVFQLVESAKKEKRKKKKKGGFRSHSMNLHFQHLTFTKPYITHFDDSM